MDWDELNTRVWRGRGAAAARAVISTGFPQLDSYLPGGGWPKGAITEVFIDGYGIGELALLMPAMASLTQSAPAKAKKWIAKGVRPSSTVQSLLDRLTKPPKPARDVKA